MLDTQSRPALSAPRRSPASSTARVCEHCASPLHASQQGPFCCIGCELVHDAITGAGLDRYYELRGPVGLPVGDAMGGVPRRDFLRALQAKIATASDVATTSLRVQGIRCVACVWLIEQLFARAQGGVHLDLNPSTGMSTLRVRPDFDLAAFVAQVESFGYLVGPAIEDAALDLSRDKRDGLLLRATLASVCAGNAMFFAAALYLGLESGPLFRLLHGLNFACASIAVLLGAPVFVSSSLRALRLGVLHLDLPIALGIVGSYAAASWSYASGETGAAYYDSLAVFVALMLWGRYLQDRIVVANRRRMLSDTGVEGLVARRLEQGLVAEVPAETVAAGDHLVLPAGDMLLVAADLQGEGASFALDSIDGEPAPRDFACGQRIPAGAVNLGTKALTLVAREAFADSAALPLLRSPADTRTEADAVADRSAARFNAAYVVGVLCFASLGLSLALYRGEHWSEALAIATAVCVVTCPCSIGIALPLAREATYRKLQQLGLFVRSPTFLQRALPIQQVVFDKTGTLTEGTLHVSNRESIRALGDRERAILLAMVSRSSHPRSRAITRCLRAEGAIPPQVTDIEVHEVAGAGLSCRLLGLDYRLGSADHTEQREPVSDSVCFTRDGTLVARIDLAERVRPAAEHELDRLTRLGYRVHILSGDRQEAVDRVASVVGLPSHRALGQQTPVAKRDWIASHQPGTTLMVGDGLNDSLALEAAACAGTPAVSRTSVCARSDFYFTSAGLAPVTACLLAARHLRRLTQRNWAFLAAYNTASVAAATAGVMEPLVAAVIMPISSIASITLTTLTLNRWSATWRS